MELGISGGIGLSFGVLFGVLLAWLGLRSRPAALQARGAGIAALDTTLDYLLTRGGFQATDVCSSTGWIRFLNRDGSVQHEQRHRYRFSSWNTIYRSLLSLLDADRYQLGTEVTGFAERDGTVTVNKEDAKPLYGQGFTDVVVEAVP